MNEKSKKVLAGVLLVGVGIVWIPQIMAMTKPPPPPRPEVPAVVATPLPGADDGAPHTPNAPEPQTQGTETEDLARALSASVDSARTLSTARNGLDLERLFGSSAPAPVLETRPAEPPPVPAVVATAPVTAESEYDPRAADPLASIAPPDPIDQFLATHPLQGTLIGATERIAFLGPRHARVGDELVPGLVVTRIETSRVTFSRGGTVVHSDLVPFEARARVAPTSSTGTTGGSGATPPAAASVVSQTASAPATAEDLGRLLRQLEESARETSLAPTLPAQGASGTGAQTTGQAPANKEPHGS